MYSHSKRFGKVVARLIIYNIYGVTISISNGSRFADTNISSHNFVDRHWRRSHWQFYPTKIWK